MTELIALAVAVGFLTVSKGRDALDAINPLLPSWNRYDSVFKAEANTQGLPSNGWKWMKAIAIGESNLGENPLVKMGSWSSDGLSKGLMQLTVLTANDYGKWFPVDQLKKSSQNFNQAAYDTVANYLNDPALSIKISTQHFTRIYRKFGNTLEHAVKAYNQGEGNMAKEIALRSSLGVPLTGHTISQYPDAATYWSRFVKHLAQVEAKP